MNVIISPSIKRVSERIDTSGNIINARTKEIIKPNTIETVSPEDMKPKVAQEPLEVKDTKIDSMSDKINKMVEAKIAEKIDAIVAERVAKALENL